MNAMAIPHDVDPYPRLARTVRCPARRTAASAAHDAGDERGRSHDRDPRTTERRTGGSPGGATARGGRERAVPHAHARPVRGSRPRRASRSSRRTPTRSSRRSGSISATHPMRSCSSATPGRTSTASASASRAGSADSSCRRPRRASSRSSRATRSAASCSAARTRSSLPHTARRSFATSTAVAATGRSRTSATS